jgi:hypothetical protein
MTGIARLVTFADLRVGDAHCMSVSLRQEAMLADGRRLLLLDDRGWTSSLHGTPEDDAADIWALTSIEEIEETAQVVVGPDEAFDGRSPEDMEADHWAQIADVLRQQGVLVDARELGQLPHDVVLSEQLLALLDRDP